MPNQLFDISTMPAAAESPPVPAPGNATPPAQGAAVGVISAQQSAITFAGAPAAVTLVWNVLGSVQTSLANSKPLAVALSLIVGMLIYWQSAPVNGTRREKVTGFVFALINSFAIAAAALGISTTTTRSPGGG